VQGKLLFAWLPVLQLFQKTFPQTNVQFLVFSKTFYFYPVCIAKQFERSFPFPLWRSKFASKNFKSLNSAAFWGFMQFILDNADGFAFNKPVGRLATFWQA